MENRFAEELYSENLQLSKLDLTSSAKDQQNNLNGKNMSCWVDMELLLLYAFNKSVCLSAGDEYIMI